MNDWRLDYADLCKKGMRVALIAALLWGMLYSVGVRPVHAMEVTVNNWGSLFDAFSSSASGTTIILGENITQSAGALTIPSATDLTLDLAGRTLSITSTGISAIRVDSGRALTIEDSSAEGTGTLIARTNGFGHAGIGGEGGEINSTAGTITINGGRIEAYGGPNAAGIGGNMGSSGGTVNINEGTVKATGGSGGAGIGGGYNGSGGTININGGTVTAAGGLLNSAGIGGGYGAAGGTITITDGTVNATGGIYAAGIGGGYGGAGGTITIHNGTVTAFSSNYGAGIGGGNGGAGGTITIYNGTVTATSNAFGAGIGGGFQGGGGTIAIHNGTVIPSTRATPNVSVIGPGYEAPNDFFNLVNGGAITIPAGYQLIIPEGVTVDNSGTINGNGSISGAGSIENTGTITVAVVGPEVGGTAFVLRFDLNGGTGTIPSITVYAATLQVAGATLPEPVREGYEFEGWYTQPDGGVEMTGTYAISGDMDLFARWKDITPPRVTLSSPAGNPLNGSFEVMATFSESVTGFGVEDISITNGTIGDFVVENDWTYTFVVTPTADGPVTAEIPMGVAEDAAGNGNTASLPLSRTYDGSAPTVTLSTSAGEPTNSVIEVTATFSEAVTDFSVEDIEVTNGVAGDFVVENGWTYTFVVTPTADGLVTAEIPMGVAEDAAGNGNTASLPLSRTYDATPPLIELDPLGSSEPAQSVQPIVTVTDASELTTLRYAWTLRAAAPEMGDPEWRPFVSGEALILAVGDGDRYVHVYARDAAGNEQAVSFGPYVLDNTAPVIGLNGESPLYLAVGQPYVEPGAWATDNIDGPLDSGTMTITGEVDTHRLGFVEVRYTVSDRAGNIASLTRSVYVYDGDSPVITLRGDNPMVLAVGSEFVDPGATAQDAQDGDVTAAITVNGSVDANEVGTYTLAYNVSDNAGNEALEKSRTIHVIAPPELALTGPSEITISRGGSFNDPGATASDAYYGDLSNRIVVSGSVDTQAPGVYTLRYTVENPIGQAAEAVRMVTVRQATSPGGVNNGETREDEGEDEETGQTHVLNINLNGVSVPVKAAMETTSDGRTVVRLRLTAEQMLALFDAPVDAVAKASGRGEVVVLGLTAIDSPAYLTEAVVAVDGIGDVVALELPAEALHEVRRTQPGARLWVIVDGHGLLLPLNALEWVSADAVVAVTIGRASAAVSDAAKRAIADLEAKALLEHPVVYTLTEDGRPVRGWDAAYRERMVTLPTPADAHHSTGVWIDERGGLHFVPSVFTGDGHTVTLPTRQDGAYTVIRSDRTFADVEGHWAQTDMEQMANKRIVAGRETGAFTPFEPVTRAEFAALLVRGLGLPEQVSTRSFADVAEASWYAGAVGTASEAGLILGYEDGTFRPQERITREQMAVMVARAAAYAGQAPRDTVNAAISASGMFSDEAEIAFWAKEAVAHLAESGIIQGLTATEFAPKADASRAQSVVMLKRLLQYLGFINP